MSSRLPVVLLWHMHQPQYRDALSGRYVLPWTYLHAIKDYVDMAAHLEANPAACAVVNFTPVLLEQLEELAARVAAHLEHGEALPDPVLASLSDAPLPTDRMERLALVHACQRAQRANLIERYPPFLRLVNMAESFGTPELVQYLSDAFLHDLAVWYHIAWLAETVKRSDLRVATLLERATDFRPAHRRMLLELIGELLGGLLPRYRRLADSGQCELATSPYGHPIMPLLLDFQAAREAVPTMTLPHAARYPGGAARAAWHMDEALRVFERVFGHRPIGCWPSEGAISAAALQVIEEHGIRWIATSESVLNGCLPKYADAGGSDRQGEHKDGHGEGGSGGDGGNGNGDNGGGAGAARSPALQGYRMPGHDLNLFFRHDQLSDLIGFTYSKWHGDDAVRNFVGQLERIAHETEALPGRIALVALDGENAWEYYPFNGFYFLKGLYEHLANHPQLELTTLSRFVASAAPAVALDKVVAGSWVHGTLSTWMGDRDKNAGWDLLVQAKDVYDETLAAGVLNADERAAAERQLALCESSDWFWWFGDYNPYEAVRDFDALYRHQLANLYRLLKRAVPASLDTPISVGRGAPESGGVMRRAQE
jgi:alpha-amylase/alpha-mannosidase (GH57 family)